MRAAHAVVALPVGAAAVVENGSGYAVCPAGRWCNVVLYSEARVPAARHGDVGAKIHCIKRDRSARNKRVDILNHVERPLLFEFRQFVEKKRLNKEHHRRKANA